MKSLTRTLLAALLFFQSAAPRAIAGGNEDSPVCKRCVDPNARVGDIVTVNGQDWKLAEVSIENGISMWKGERVGPNLDITGSSFEKGNHGENSANPNTERLTGRDLSHFDDSDKLSSEDRKQLREIQKKIIDRLNAETVADAAATDRELEGQLGDLQRAVDDAGEISHGGGTGPGAGSDPLAALNNSIQAKSGGNFYPDQAGWQANDDSEYQSSHKEELTELRNRLNKHIPKSPQQADAKRTGYIVLAETDEAYLNGDEGLGNDLLGIANLIVDIATDVIPFTSIPKDFYKAVVGKDPFTGEELSGFGRALAGGFFLLAIGTAGISNGVKTGVKGVLAVTKATEAEGKLAKGLVKALEKSPTPVKVAVRGVTENVTLIGRDMERVTETAKALEKDGIAVNILNDGKFSKSANIEWRTEVRSKRWLSENQVRDTKKFKENKEWIGNALKDGDIILDLGDVPGKPKSPFYEMEKEEIQKFLNQAK